MAPDIAQHLKTIINDLIKQNEKDLSEEMTYFRGHTNALEKIAGEIDKFSKSADGKGGINNGSHWRGSDVSV